MKRLLAVSASAGSGKTFRLVNRYISLLNLDTPTNIVAITFTNKAANEMKERIIKELQNLGDDENIVEMICKELNITKDELLKRKDNLIKKFLTSDVNIQTIDSFINKILRKFSYFAGVRSSFDIGSDDREIIFNNFLYSLSAQEMRRLIDIAKKEEKFFNSLLDLFEDLYERDKELKKVKSEQCKVKSDDILEEIEKIKNEFILATAECKQVNDYFKKNISKILKGKILSSMPLQLGGIISTDSFESVSENFANLNNVLADAGCKFKKPHLIPLFLPFLALPEIRILSTGLVDVKNRSLLRTVIS